MTAELLAFAAGAAGGAGVLTAAASALRAAFAALPAGGTLVREVTGALSVAAREGRAPADGARRRFGVAGALLGFAAGLLVVGPLAAVAGAVIGAVGAARLVERRRRAYRDAVAAAAASIAVTLADALSGGASARGAIPLAAANLRGPAGSELGRVAAELELGVATSTALERLRARVGSPEIDAIVTGVLLQLRAGGDLARLLRDLARAFEDQARVEGEVRAATAQARFTGLVVVLLPLAGAGLAELASPGFVIGMLSDSLSAWLLGVGAILQLIAAVVIRRLGRART